MPSLSLLSLLPSFGVDALAAMATPSRTSSSFIGVGLDEEDVDEDDFGDSDKFEWSVTTEDEEEGSSSCCCC